MNGLDEGQVALLKSILQQRLDELAGVVQPRVAGEHDLPVSEIETSPADKATPQARHDPDGGPG